MPLQGCKAHSTSRNTANSTAAMAPATFVLEHAKDSVVRHALHKLDTQKNLSCILRSTLVTRWQPRHQSTAASSPWRSPKKKAAPQRRESQVAGDRCSSPRSDRQLSCARARQAGCARSKHVAPVRSPRRPSWARTTAAQQQQPSQRCQRRRDRRDYSLVHAAASSHCTSDMPGRVGRPQITSLAWASLVDAADERNLAAMRWFAVREFSGLGLAGPR